MVPNRLSFVRWGVGLLLCCASVALGQPPALVDSLHRQLAAAQSDSARVYWLQRLVWHHLNDHTDQAADYLAQARELAANLDATLTRACNDHYAGLIYRLQGDYPQAIEAFGRALHVYEQAGKDLAATGPLFNLGVVYGLIGDYDKSLAFFYRELAINEQLGRTTSVANTLNSMASVNRKMQDYDQALARYAQARAIFAAQDEPLALANVLSNIGGLYLEQHQYDSATSYFRQALALDRVQQSLWGVAYNLHRLGVAFEAMHHPDSATRYLVEALSIRTRLGQKLERAETMVALGAQWYASGLRSQGLDTLQAALAIAQEIGAHETQTQAHLKLAEVLRQEGRLQAAYDHLAAYTRLRDTVLTHERLRSVSEMAARYESVRKDQLLAENRLEIATVRAKVARQRLLLQLGLAGLLILGLLLVLLLLVIGERRRRHAQHLRHMQQAQELLALRSIVAGEERERRRIARDLHDGLSSLLAAVKIQFGTIRPVQQQEKFDAALAALDEANREVRRIAHNMMPEVLTHYGLVEAVSEVVSNLSAGGGIRLAFSHYGLDEQLDPTIELTVYRIIQELLNNVLKHSQATEALVQLNRHDALLTLTVEDNGVGFDPQAARRGMGLDNLRSRVSYLQGEVQIDSAPGRGTAVYIEMILPSPTL
ncbi:MAG: hypothetical protein OHK0039_27910 [Bacteroidia bacterium]